MSKKVIQSEKDVQKEIMDWLAKNHEFFYRNNVGAVVSEYNGKKRFTRFGYVGSPDVILIQQGSGKYIGIEVKATKGRQSDKQIEFQNRLEEAGGIYILAHSLDEFLEEYSKISF
jgi:hypothetical protein